MSTAQQEREGRKNTSIRQCSCQNAYQDQKYGKGLRVHNLAMKDGKPKAMRCTVCGKETIT